MQTHGLYRRPLDDRLSLYEIHLPPIVRISEFCKCTQLTGAILDRSKVTESKSDTKSTHLPIIYISYYILVIPFILKS